nr:hypothetical protein OH820_34410 [Streptomyces sp. NBC_00857]
MSDGCPPDASDAPSPPAAEDEPVPEDAPVPEEVVVPEDELTEELSEPELDVPEPPEPLSLPHAAVPTARSATAAAMAPTRHVRPAFADRVPPVWGDDVPLVW